MKNKLLSEMTQLRYLIEQQKLEIKILKSAIFGLPNMVYWKKSNGIYLGENPASIKYRTGYGIPNYSIVGMRDHDVYASQSANQYTENDLTVVNSKKPLVGEELLILPDGKCVPQLSMKSPIYDENEKVIGVFGQTIVHP